MRSCAALAGAASALMLIACGGSDSGAIAGTLDGGGVDGGGNQGVDGATSGLDAEVTSDSGSVVIQPTPDAESTEPTPDGGDVTDAGTVGANDGATDTTCGAEATKNACTTCCETLHAAGDKVYVDEVERCACKAAVCEKDCQTTACATPAKKADATCTACLDLAVAPATDAGASDGGGHGGGGGGAGSGEGVCTASVRAACQASAPCTAFAKCEALCTGK